MFLVFFRSLDHSFVRSSSRVPAHDPTLLFSNAGMNQFKDVFLGREKRDYTRACSSQKCVRAGGKHNDLEQVGRTARHLTFFEMLGNFSFGDYFKKEAIPWAWELITREFAIPREKLYVTVFREDDEAEEIWANGVGVARDRIFRLDEKDNFWAMGDTGPCGPCSEIHYDQGPAASDLGHADCKFPCDCGRYVELWNLVFMQFNRVCDRWWDSGAAIGRSCIESHLEPLPKPSVDTGAGLERLAAVLQGKLSNFDTDLFRPLIQEAADLANVDYGVDHETDVSLRIIADHARACAFLITDGVVPSNEGRGYVLRKIMRRALLRGRKLGLKEPFLYSMAAHVAQMMKDVYPELIESEPRVAKVIKAEETRFAHTVALGLTKLEERLTKARRISPGELVRHVKQVAERMNINVPSSRGAFSFELQDAEKLLAAGSDSERHMLVGQVTTGPAHWMKDILGENRLFEWPCLPGDDIFELYDTFGLPLDLIAEVSLDHGIFPDFEGFEANLGDQRRRARASWKGAEKKVASPVYQQLAENHPTAFYGYTETESHDCRIVALVVKGEAVNEVAPGTEVEIILDRTPFYSEAGGQVGDIGYFAAPGSPEHVAQINDTYRPVTGLTAHKAVAKETLHVGDLVTAHVDSERRDSIRRNHTATHLLHAALRRTLGTHVKQAGSLVAPDRLRFDFTHYAALGEQDLLDIEDLVNEHVLKNEEVVTTVMDLDTAVNTGAMALFGEKYADQVRVLTIDHFSKELCGGTHVRRTGDIGLFKITGESSVAAGTRRIEALTGTGVLDTMRREMQTLAALSEVLRAKPGELLEAAEKLEETEKKLRKELEAQQMKRAAASAGDLAESAKEVKGVRVVAAHVEVPMEGARNALRQMVDTLRAKLGSGVIVLGSGSDTDGGKVELVAAVTKDLTGRLDAGKL
ncbi:MAG: alanine--tRNA ligase, partial [Terriglobia bacterium]